MRRSLPGFWLFLAILVFLAYRPGLNGPFVFDDSVNIGHNTHLAIGDLSPQSLRQAAFSSNSGLLKRPVSMLSFALNYSTTGLDPYYFKLTNLVIHIFNALGILLLTRALLRIYRMRFEPDLSYFHIDLAALVIASAWALHPFNLTSVLYTVQRMTSLSAFFSIFGLVLFVWGRTRLYEGKKGIMIMLGSLLLFTPLAALSKENGALLPVLMLIAEATLFGFRTTTIAARRFLLGIYSLVIGAPLVIGLVWMATNASWIFGGYANRDFTLYERLMTESRVLWFYLGQIVLPNTAQMGLYHDDIAVSRSLLQPASTLFSIVGLVVLAGLSVAARKKAPLLAFGVLFYLAGHLLESTVIPLEIAHEHRNYLPMYGILLPMFYYLLYPLKYQANLRLRQFAAFFLIALFAFGTYSRAGKWANPFDLFQAAVDHHPNSSISNGELAAIYSNFVAEDPLGITPNYISAKELFEKSVTLDKNDTKPLFGLIMLNAKSGRAVEFGWLQELARRLEYAPYAAISSDKLIKLTNCQMGGSCKLQTAAVEDLLNAALRNPNATGSNRSKILYAQSGIFINAKHDYAGALAVMHEMADIAPSDLEYRFALIKFLTALKMLDEADAEIQKARSRDMQGMHTSAIAGLEQQVADIRALRAPIIK